MKSFIQINSLDNVAVALQPLAKGTVVELDDIVVTLTEDIQQGHKFALKNLKTGDSIIKYGNSIGHATADIPAGSWIHTHNLKTGLGELLTYSYNKNTTPLPERKPLFFQGYRRKDGRAGVRNEIWIIPTVGCVLSILSFCQRQNSRQFFFKFQSIRHIDNPPSRSSYL